MNSTKLTLAAVGVAVLLGVWRLLDYLGKTEVAASVPEDARLTATRFDRDYRECQRLMGPTAYLVQIQGTNHYACREPQMQPMPEAVPQRYAALEAAR